jgi:hypothetical protein
MDMLLAPLLCLSVGMILFRVTHHIDGEIEQLVLGLIGFCLLLLGLILEPIVIKLTLILLVLIVPNCFQAQPISSQHCSRFCITRKNCDLINKG